MEISRDEAPAPDAEPQAYDPPAGLDADADADPARRRLSLLDWAALIAVVAGGLNWGLIAAVKLDVFASILPHTGASRAVYGLIGLAALHCVVLLFRLGDEGDDDAGTPPRASD